MKLPCDANCGRTDPTLRVCPGVQCLCCGQAEVHAIAGNQQIAELIGERADPLELSAHRRVGAWMHGDLEELAWL
jgi:hypothetical protein